MFLLEEYKANLLKLKPEIENLKHAFQLESAKQQLEELEKETAKQDFWGDVENSQKTLQKMTRLKNILAKYQHLAEAYEDIVTLIEIASEENDESLEEEIKKSLSALSAEIETEKLSTLLKGEYDAKNAIITFHAGAGGTEAQDWAEMLYRMYSRWAERHGYKHTVLDFLDGEEAGLKSISILIEGENAYGFLKSEAGVHRLVRISPFDSSGRRHTSFASLEVMPEIDDADTSVQIRDEDLRVDTYRASGAGGQHVNKTDSAIRITHLPTGIVVSSQSQRSQTQNRATALKMLKSKLIEIKEREHLEKIEDIKGEQKEIGWGSQIRSYVFMPYTLVKDHRTNYENGNIAAVMDGDLDGFINAYLLHSSRQEQE